MVALSSLTGGGVSYDETRNSYGTILPPYITCCCLRSQTSTVVGPTCTTSYQSVKGGIIPLSDNRFVAFHIDAGSNCASCHFVRARVIDIDNNGCISPQSNWTLLCCSGGNSCLEEADATAGSDGCNLIFMSARCNSGNHVGIYCVAPDGSSICWRCSECSSCGSNGRIIYSGNPGVVVIGPRDNGNLGQCLVRFENGVAGRCAWRITPQACCTIYCYSWTPLVLNSESMSLNGWFLCNDNWCYSSRFIVWNNDSCCWCANNCAECLFYGSDLCCSLGWNSELCFATPSATQNGRSVKIGPSFTSVGSEVTYYIPQGQETTNYYSPSRSESCTNKAHYEGYVYFKPPMTYEVYFNRDTGVVNGQDQRGCQARSEIIQYFTKFTYNERQMSTNPVSYPCCLVVTQQNGTKSMGIFGKACGFRCSGGPSITDFTTWETVQKPNPHEYMSGYGGAPVWSYGHTQTDIIYSGDCNYLGTGVVGKKWLVGMEFAGCCACECVGFKVYEMISCNTGS